ncbi:acyl-CoA dehydrogenase family protein [Streptomyces sp. NPDC091972]|uniref:acyl-CoA dehydrogenase family protein n=1 Tax=Streptomyces sp. NPDC091972 TaxID=3366007 RepID=UPI00381733CD
MGPGQQAPASLPGAALGGPGAALAGRSAEADPERGAPAPLAGASGGAGVVPAGRSAAVGAEQQAPASLPGAALAGRSAVVGAERQASVPSAGAGSAGAGAAPSGLSAVVGPGREAPVSSAGAGRGGGRVGRSAVVGAERSRSGVGRSDAVVVAAGQPSAVPVHRGSGWRLYGQVDQVLDGHSADLLLVAAHAGGFARSRTLLFLVRGDAPGLVRSRQTALDATRPQARVQLRDVEAELLGVDGADVLGALARTGDTAAAVLACEAVGAADRVLATTVEYAGQREQFGRPIGSFQAVKHRLADVYVQLQAARSAACFAAWAAAHEEQRVGGLALAQALEALRTAAAEGIQFHGGIGFTWEHEAQRYFKRAAADELLFGPAHRLRAHAAEVARLFERTEVSV